MKGLHQFGWYSQVEWVLLVENVDACWVNDEYSNISLLRCIDNCSIYMGVAKAVADDHQSGTRQIGPELPVIPVQKGILVDLDGLVSTHNNQPTTSPAAA